MCTSKLAQILCDDDGKGRKVNSMSDLGCRPRNHDASHGTGFTSGSTAAALPKRSSPSALLW